MDLYEKIRIGHEIGYWTVVEKASKGENGAARWLCRCECGTEKVVRQIALKNGTSKSCGCHRYDCRKKNAYSRDVSGKHTRLYGRWANIKDRCCNPKCKGWEKYGGRGITICDEWKNDFKAFKKWAEENGYSDDLQIDREDNNKGYSPENCRFVTAKKNSNNRRNSKKVMYGGRVITIAEVEEATKIPASTLYKHIKGGGLDEYIRSRKM